jgi:hypothetical protein
MTMRYVGRSVAVLVAAIVLTSCSMSSGTPWSWSARRLVPDASAPEAIDCPTSTGCVALLADATSVDLTGTTWSAPIPVENVERADGPDGLACVSLTWCVAIDGLNRALVYDGQRWSTPVRIEPVARATIDTISCASSTFCVAGDSNGDASIYHGQNWSKPTPVADSSGLAGISCPAAGLCFAVDAESSEVFRYDHGRWSISADLNISTPQGGSEPNSLEAISCGSRDFCVVLDDFGEAFTYDGKWSSSAHTFDAIEDEDAELSCTPFLTCVAVDDSDDVVVDQAGAWSSPHHLGRSNAILQDVACALRSRCVVIDDKGGFFIGHPAR